MSRRNPNNREPTPQQVAILEYLHRYIDARGYSPTLQEIAEHMRTSKVTVFEHVHQLHRKGLLEMTKRARRSLRPTGAMPRACPHCGKPYISTQNGPAPITESDRAE